jgi:hypothetical protein
MKIRALTAVAAIALTTAGCATPLSYGPKAPSMPASSEIANRANDIVAQVNAAKGPQLYVAGGYGIVYEKCTNYFNNLIELQNQTGWTGDTIAATGTMTSAMVALRRNTSDAARSLARIAAGGAFAASIFSSYEDRILMTPYPTETKSLILAGLKAFETAAPPENTRSAIEAAMLVQRYAELCTYSGITRAAKQALANARPQSEGGPASVLTPDDRFDALTLSYLFELEGQVLTDRQVAALYYYLVDQPGTWSDGVKAAAVMKELPARVVAKLTNDGKAIDPSGLGAAIVTVKRIGDRNSALRTLAATVAKEVAAQKAAVEAEEAVAPQTVRLRPRDKASIIEPAASAGAPSTSSVPFIRY